MLPAKPKKNILRNVIIIALVVIIYVWAFTGIEFSGIKDNAAQLLSAMGDGLFHPDWSYVYTGDGEDLISLMIQTIAIAFLGTMISSVLSIPFAFLAANMRHKPQFTTKIGKFILTLIRTFPEIVLAVLFIKVVGAGPFAGVLAVGLHSIGMLGKLYSEAIEEIDYGPIEAIRSAGGSSFDVFRYATMPQLVPEFISYTLYRFEVSVRSASILGLVGAGGIGTPLIFAINGRSWDRVGIILLGIVVTVTIIDFISGKIRAKLA